MNKTEYRLEIESLAESIIEDAKSTLIDESNIKDLELEIKEKKELIESLKKESFTTLQIEDLELELEVIRDEITLVTSCEEIEAFIFDKGINHEIIDSHHFIIYTHNHSNIIDNSDNNEAYLELYNNEDLGQLVIERGPEAVTQAQAFYAMLQDLDNEIYEQTKC